MSNVKCQIFFGILFLVILLLPQVSWAYAGIYSACPHGYPEFNKDLGKCCKDGSCTDTADPVTVCHEGLVPCGSRKPYWENGSVVDGACDGDKKEEGIPCQFCHFFVMLDAILDFVITMAFIVAVLMIVFGGVLFIVGGGLAPDWVNRGKSILKSVVTGLIIIFAAWVIVNTIFMFLGVAGWVLDFSGPSKWSQINCPIELPQ